MKNGKILIIDDNEDVLFALNLLLEPYVEQIKVTTQPERIEHFMSTFVPDVILLDMNFRRDAISGQEGFFWLEKIKAADPDAVVLFITAYADTEKAVRAIKAGATDFIPKPWEKEKLLATLSAALKLRESRTEINTLKQRVEALGSPDDTGFEIIGESDVMQELFDQEDDYYNVVFADHALDIDNGRLYATVSKENVEESSQIFTDMMGPMVVMLVAISALIFMIVMYLMMKVMIDRSAFSISLMKVFGYRRREIRRLYLDGNFYVILLGALICVPLAKWSMDLVYPHCIANVAIGMDLEFTPQIYIMIYGGIMLCYMVINFLLVGRLNKLVPAEVLKNRE